MAQLCCIGPLQQPIAITSSKDFDLRQNNLASQEPPYAVA
jgi:hypothetical protein